MKRKIRILSGLVVTGLLVFTCFTIFSLNKIQSHDPSQTVKNYFDLAERGIYSEIGNYTTYTPEAYFIAFDKWLELNRKSQEGKLVEKTVEEKPRNLNLPQGKHTLSESEKRPSETILVGIPERINSFKLYISEIQNVWIKGEEARVRVIIKSRDSESYRGESDFLLYQKDGQWKIFMEDIPPSIPVYGMPEQ